MKKTMKMFLNNMAALATMGTILAACSKEEGINVPQEQKDGKVTLTTTVGLNTDATKALDAEGHKTFAEGEQIAVIYKNTEGETVKAISEALPAGEYGSNATFTVTLTDPDRTQEVTYIYPAVMAKDNGSVNYDALASQDGTLATLSSTLDLGTKSGAWNEGALPSLTLDNQLAILAVTLKNSDGSSDITSGITGMTVSDGTYTYSVSRSAAEGPIYVAIRPTSSTDISITATDGTANYTKSLSGKTYAAGNGYSVSWRMKQVLTYPIALSEVTNGYIGSVVAADGKVYKDKDAATAAGTSAVAMVAYVGSDADCVHGLAIALEDVDSEGYDEDESYSNNFYYYWTNAATAVTTWASVKAVTGGTWRLPSAYDFQHIFIACGSTDTYIDSLTEGDSPTTLSYGGLNSMLAIAGGTALYTYHWSSTEIYIPGGEYSDETYAAWRFEFDSSGCELRWDDKEMDYEVRAVLEF